MDNKIITRAADNARVLIAAMVEKANSGHPGGAMGGADFTAALYSSQLIYDPRNPRWIARDRFFLDPGHMSPMLYSILALTGRYTLEELQEFRQWGSVTPGHPELDVDRGVENSSGPLGQGHVMAVGCALAERMLVAQFGDIVAHKTYAYISDGGIQEEISQGAGRIAGHLGLSNLIMFYDANDVQLSTKVDDVTNEDTAAKYRAWNWNVLTVDGSDIEAIRGALELAHAETERPTLIIGKTVMAKAVVATDGSSLEGAVSTHGQPLSKAGADIPATILGLGGNPEHPFEIWPDVAEAFEARRKELIEITDKRHAAEKAWAEANPELAAKLQEYIDGKMQPIDWDNIEVKANAASRNASAAVLTALAEKYGNMMVSSADLANSDKTDGFLKKTYAITPGDFGGRFLHSGVAELTMASICNGVALHGGMIAGCGTFFVFSDYIKPAMRMSALMGLPVKYVFSHDAFRVGEDGPTHQPIEHEAQVRLLEQMDNMNGKMSILVMRPADSAETIACWRMAMENTDTPSVLILSRQDLNDIPAMNGNRRAEAKGAEKGGYLVKKVDGEPQITLVANGSEVSLLVEVAAKLEELGVKVNVASIPSIGLFLRQPEEYQNEILPAGGKRFGLSAGLPSLLFPLMMNAGQWKVYGLERFGASAPYKVLDQKFGFTTENILEQVKKIL
ncbi:MAG: transketolase [Muribaculaceae bacterium]|nr:transketolase [Muribaculaceae bacterium]